MPSSWKSYDQPNFTGGRILEISEESDEPLLLSMARFVLPFALWTMLVGVILYTGWRPLSTDRRPAIITVILIFLFAGFLTLPPVDDYFGIIVAPRWVRGILATFLLVWLLGFRLIIRQKRVDKLLLPR